MCHFGQVFEALFGRFFKTQTICLYQIPGSGAPKSGSQKRGPKNRGHFEALSRAQGPKSHKIGGFFEPFGQNGPISMLISEDRALYRYRALSRAQGPKSHKIGGFFEPFGHFGPYLGPIPV